MKEHYNYDYFTALDFSNLTNKKVKQFWKGRHFKLMTYRFVVNALTHCTTLLGDNLRKKLFIE